MAARGEPEVELLRLTTAGSVDDGKSTLIGRLLYETQCAFSDQISEARRATTNASVREAGEEIDFALLTDGLRAEREQGITIDVAYRYVTTPRRKFIIADTPGHEQYTRNMATGASTAHLALILVDARAGVLPQSKRHAFIASLLGIKHVLVCVNKMDLVGYSREVFEGIVRDFADFATRLEVPDLHFLPVCALRGDNLVRRSPRMPWYQGPPLLEHLETLQFGSDRNLIDLRFPVQSVLRPDQDFRGYCGRVASGILRPGDEVMVLPSRRTTRVSRIVTWDGDLERAFPPQSVTVCLEDEVDVSRGDMLVHPNNQPEVARRFEAMVVGMSETPLAEGAALSLKHTTQSLRARIEAVRYRVDVETLGRVEAGGALGLNEIGRVVISTHRPLMFDAYRRNRSTGSLILIDPLTNATVGAGMIIQRQAASLLPAAARDWHAEPDELDDLARVDAADRERLLSHGAVTVWLTGLPHCGGAEVAFALERALYERGVLARVLSGRRLRRTLSHDLDHSPADVSEHLRRVGVVARLLNEAGVISICSFVSPTRAVRRRVRELVGADRFLEVHVASPLAWCEARDPDGVYSRARSGELVNVAGVDVPYEVPEGADQELRPDQVGFEAAALQVLELLQRRGVVPGAGPP